MTRKLVRRLFQLRRLSGHGDREVRALRIRLRQAPRLLALEDRTVPSTFMVSNTADSGIGSLRQAIDDANKAGGADTISFQATAYGTILVSKELAITDAVYLEGPAPDLLELKANGASRVFTIDNPSVTGTLVTIHGMTISSAANSGIYLQDEALTLDRCRVTGNSASRGGGVYVRDAAASLTIQKTTIDNNTASMHGGGIYFFNGGTLFIENSTISGNKSNGGAGGGLYFFGVPGGGIIHVRNSTISGNTSAQEGGGIALRNFFVYGTLQIINSTITNNTAGSVGGGGIARASGSGTIVIESTVVSGNINATAPDILSSGTVNVNYSAIGSPTGFTLTGSNNLAFGTALSLGPLQLNGGPTMTHLPAVNSALVNKGSNLIPLPNDQRGVGYPRNLGGAPDIGAVEVQDLGVRNSNDSGPGSLRQVVADANVIPGFNTVEFDYSYFSTPKTINLTTGEISITEEMYIFGIDGGLVTIDAKNMSRAFNVATSKAGGDVRFLYLTITGGNASNGGAIYVANSNAIVRLAYCTVTGNTATANGGGVYLAPGGFLDLQSSTISNNTAGVDGGGIYFFSGGNLSTQYSTISGNKANGGGGGGVYFFGTSTFFDLTNTTISGNTAFQEGGGIAFRNFNGTMSALSCTITANHAFGDSGGVGGGIANNSALGKLDLNSTIVSGNINGTAADISSPGTVTANYCAIGENKGFTLTGANNLPYGANLYLGPLQNNGGWTKTHAFDTLVSPLFNAGSKSIGLTYDQRFGDRVSLGQADIGAFEQQVFMVTNTNDNGPGSLRDAANRANSLTPSDDWIEFDPIVFATDKTITLTTGQIPITDTAQINGESVSGRVTISGNNASRIFSIDGPGTFHVGLSGLTMTKGKAGYGGAIWSDENLTLYHCVLTQNTGDYGGAVYVWNGQLTVVESQVAGNTAASGGGFITLGGATVQRSTIADNTTSAFAAGIVADKSLLLEDSTISGNKLTGDYFGGGILLNGSFAAPAVIRNSTISGNSGFTGGGGIYLNSDFTGTLLVQNSTITNNSAKSGGGIGRSKYGSGLIALESSIVSGNSATTAGPDLYTTGTVNAKTSLIGSIAGVMTFVPDAVTTFLLGKAPLLGPLQNNGGPTQTHALLVGSPAINNGSNPAGEVYDQRGYAHTRSYGTGVDIGAFEVQAPAKVQSVVINDGAVQRSRVTKVTVTFDTLVHFSPSPTSAFELRRQSDMLLAGVAVDLSNSTGEQTVAVLTFNGALSEFGSLQDGRYTLTIPAANALDVSNQPLDGNGDGTGGDPYVLSSSGTSGIFRLFGDGDGNGTVNSNDFALFRTVFGVAGSVFDFNSNGVVNSDDFAEFRKRFGISLMP